MQPPKAEVLAVPIAELGERLSALRLCDPSALAAVQRSLEAYGQLTALTLFGSTDGLEIIDGFKRVRAARALGWSTLLARVDVVDAVTAKLQLCALHERRGLTELEEAWLVRSLFREDGLSLPNIARRMGRHRSWIWRRLMLVEALEPEVQVDVRLGLLTPRAAVAVSRLPRGNQKTASLVVARRGLTFRQTELLVEEALDSVRPAEVLARRLDGPSPIKKPGPTPTRAVRNEADWMAADILRIRDLASRLMARIGGTPLESFPAAATELLQDALQRLSPVIRALDAAITTATGQDEDHS